MTVEIDLSSANIPGFPKIIQLKNAAEEETLAELLSQFIQYRKDFKKSSKIAEKQQKAIDKILKQLNRGGSNNSNNTRNNGGGGNNNRNNGGGGNNNRNNGGGGNNNRNNGGGNNNSNNNRNNGGGGNNNRNNGGGNNNSNNNRNNGGGGNNNRNNGGGGAGGRNPASPLQQSLAALNNVVSRSVTANRSATSSQLQYMSTLGKVSMASLNFASSLTQLAMVSMTFVRSLSGVGNSMSQAAGALSDLPIVGGVLSSMLGAVASASEDVYNEYTKLAATGASFNGSFTTIINSASDAGLTFEQFGSIVASNSEAMMLLGGTTQAGAKRFAELGKAMKNSNINDQLLQMGYTTEQVNSGMASYVAVMGTSSSLETMSTQEIVDGSANYLKELDALAKITGKTRDEKQKEFEALNRDVQFRAMTLKMGAEEKAELMSFINSFPDASKAAVIDMMATGTATTKSAQNFAALNNKTAAEIMRYSSTMRQTNTVSKEALAGIKKNAILNAKQSADTYQNFARVQGEMSEAYMAQADLALQDVDGKEKALAEQEKLNKDADKAAQELGAFKSKVAKVSNEFTAGLLNSQAIETLDTAFTSFAKFMSNTALPIINIFFAALQPVVSVVAGVVDIIGNLLGPTLKMVAFVAEKVGWVLNYALSPVIDILAGAAEYLGYVLAGAAAYVGVSAAALAVGLALPVLPIMLLVGAVTLAVVYWDEIVEGFKWGWQQLKGIFPNITSGIEWVFSIVESIFPKIVNALMYPLTTLRNAFSWLADRVIGMFSGDGITTMLSGIGSAIASIFSVIGDIVTTPFKLLGKVAMGVIDVYVKVYKWIWSGFKKIFLGVLNVIMIPFTLVSKAIMGIVGLFSGGSKLLKSVFPWILDSIKTLFFGWVDIITAPFEMFGKIVDLIINGLTTALDWLKKKLKWTGAFDDDDDDDDEKSDNQPKKETTEYDKTVGGGRGVGGATAEEIAEHDRQKDEEEKEGKKRLATEKELNKNIKKVSDERKNAEHTLTKTTSGGGSVSTSGGGSTTTTTSSTTSGGGSTTISSSGSVSTSGGGSTGVMKRESSSGGSLDSSSGSGSIASSGSSDMASSIPSGDIAGKLLNFIGKHESNGNYNILVGGKTNPDLTKMTVAEVQQYQSGMIKRGHESTAVGKYQIIKDTLAGLIKGGYASPNDIFNPATQDKLAIGLLKWRGLNKYKSGKLSKDRFADNLSQEWASLPYHTGRSYYAGVGSNKAGDRAGFMSVFARDGGMFSGPESGYPATLHGDEAVVPLKDGNIPVHITSSNNNDQSALIDLFKEFNSKMDILIALNASISESNKNQLRVQKKGLGNPEILG